MEIIEMSQNEMLQGEVILQVLNGKMSQEEASLELGVSLRHIKWICKRCKKKGLPG